MKRTLALIAVLTSLAALTGCVAAVVGGAAAGGYYVGKDERSAEQIALDATLTAEIKSRLIAEPGIRAFTINVDTYLKNVTLKGQVGTSAQRSTAERVARKAKGVRSVRNELTVK
jgi:hyperosmotically inducible periplasmic protein